MTSNAFAALQGLNDAQLPRAIAAGGGGGKAKKTAAASVAASAGNNSNSAPSKTTKPPLPPTTVTAMDGPAAGDDDDDGFTPVVASRGKRDKKEQAAALTAPAPAATTAAPNNNKKLTKESRSASKTWADEIEEEEEERHGDGGGAPSSNGNTATAAATAGGKKKGAAAAKTADSSSSSSTPFLRDPLVWVDLEMTGLDPRNDTIIEIAVMVSDGQLQRVVEGPEIAIHHPDSVLEGMNEWSREQHAKSGLTSRCRASKVSLAEAEERVLDFVKKHCEYQAGIFAGNSVHVDRCFLMMHMPKLVEHLHYRIVDVSSVAELARRWHPKAWREAPKKKKAHTALADVRESLAELRYYRERLFNKRA